MTICLVANECKG